MLAASTIVDNNGKTTIYSTPVSPEPIQSAQDTASPALEEIPSEEQVSEENGHIEEVITPIDTAEDSSLQYPGETDIGSDIKPETEAATEQDKEYISANADDTLPADIPLLPEESLQIASENGDIPLTVVSPENEIMEEILPVSTELQTSPDSVPSTIFIRVKWLKYILFAAACMIVLMILMQLLSKTVRKIRYRKLGRILYNAKPVYKISRANRYR